MGSLPPVTSCRLAWQRSSGGRKETLGEHLIYINGGVVLTESYEQKDLPVSAFRTHDEVVGHEGDSALV